MCSLREFMHGRRYGSVCVMSNFLRRTWAEVDIDAVKHNFEEIRKAADPKAKIMCVIKADAYGHGAVFLGKLYEKLGASCFAVSNLEEAMQLRENGICLPILILGFTPAAMARMLAENHISQAVFSEEYAEELSGYAEKEGVRVKIHIKLDTGMSRIGFMYQNIVSRGWRLREYSPILHFLMKVMRAGRPRCISLSVSAMLWKSLRLME